MKRALIAIGLSLLGLACKRNTPVALSFAMSEDGGCAELKDNPKFGKIVCWGPGVAATKKFPNANPGKMIGGGKKLCGVFENQKLACWEGNGDPVDTGMKGYGGVKAAIGRNHYCGTWNWSGDHFECRGSNDAGQFGTESEWLKNRIQFVVVGEASTCVGWEGGNGILCRGRGVPSEPLLVGSELRDLAAGPNHMCAVTKQGRLYCWGKNDVGQLGDGTTNNAAMPIAVTGIDAVAQVAVGARHTCALLGNRTVSCWGANDRHQLANGTTTNSARPAMVLGALGVWSLEAAGDGTCARLGQDGEIRCWGANDHGQLGDGSTAEHTVPAAIKFH